MSTSNINTEDIQRTIDFLYKEGDTFELCAIGKGDRGKLTASGWYRHNGKPCINPVSITGYRDTYVTLNPTVPALEGRSCAKLKEGVGRTSDKDIPYLHNLLLDFDPVRPSETASSDKEHEAALNLSQRVRDYLASRDWPESLHADSGNGAALIYALPGLENAQENIELVKNCIAATADIFDTPDVKIDRSVYNPARLIRLFGTMNQKGDSIPERPHRLSKIISVPETRNPVSIEYLRELAAQGIANNEHPKQERRTGSGRIDVESYLTHYGKQIKKIKPHGSSTLYVLDECVFDPSHRGGEAAIVQGPNGELAYQCFHKSCQGQTWADTRVIISGNDKLGQFMRGNNAVNQEREQTGLKAENSTCHREMVFTPLSELLAEPDEEYRWVIDGLLATGGLGVCGGKPKTGKSTLIRQMALQVSKGEQFLGLDVTQGPVIYLELEEKRGEVKKHYRMMGAEAEDVHIFTGAAPRDVIAQVKEAIGKIKPIFIVIDPLFKVTKIKESKEYSENLHALDQLVQLAREHNTAIFAIHHSPKVDREAIDSLLGSIAIAASFDTIMIMKRYENYRTIQTVQRYGNDLPETTLEFDEERRVASIGKSKFDQDIERIKTDIFDSLHEQAQNTVFTEEQINEMVDGKTGLKRKALRRLLDEGKVHRYGKGIKGDPFRYSCFLVPDIYEEQGNENRQNDASPDDYDKNACSQKLRKNENDDKSREQEFCEGIKVKEVVIEGEKCGI
jgi:hypothetical protein